MKLLSTSTSAGASVDAGFLHLIFSAVKFENGKCEFDDAEVASRFSTMMSSTLGMKYSLLYRFGENNSIKIEGCNPAVRGLDKEAINDCAQLISKITSDAQGDQAPKAVSRSLVEQGRYHALTSIPFGNAVIVPAHGLNGMPDSGFFLFDEEKRNPRFAHMRNAGTIADAYATVMENRANRIKMEWTLDVLASELRVVRNISSTFELPVILNYAVNEVNTFIGADLTCLFLENDTGTMNISSVAGSPKEIIDEVMHKPVRDIHPSEEKQNGFVSLVGDTASHFYIADEPSAAEALSLMPNEQRYDVELLNRGLPVKCLAGVPVSFAGKMLGLLVCFSTTKEHAFRETDTGFIESVAALLATAIENSRNFRATYDALNKLSKLDTLRSNFSSIAAHELRTPLTSIRVYIELMKMGRVGKFTEPETKNIENLLASITELNEIISNMLEFTRMEALLLETEMSSIKLIPVIEEVCAIVSPQLNAKPIELELDLEKDTIRINANASLIKRVVNNLLGNAIKFTAPGGKISISLRNESDGVLLTVSDTGRGISEEDIPLIFDRYHVVDASLLHSGTGFRFGLPITKLIVERHGGKIWVESALGKGSRFFVFLPSQRQIYKEEWLSEATAYMH
jgi:signal transduction histidine kinase